MKNHPQRQRIAREEQRKRQKRQRRKDKIADTVGAVGAGILIFIAWVVMSVLAVGVPAAVILWLLQQFGVI